MGSTDNSKYTNDSSWFNEIFDRYYESMRHYAWFKTGDTQLADDIVQEVFLRLWQTKDRINPDTVKSLLYTITNNLIKSHYRHIKITYNFEINDNSEKITPNSADTNIRMEEMKSQIEKVLLLIPETSREVFLMNRIDDLSYGEIAERLGLSIKTIEKRMTLALSIIRKNINYKI
jgi:RNA polymerase sigma-70 factor (ECF subfamily)